jgi:hypothetical protein
VAGLGVALVVVGGTCARAGQVPGSPVIGATGPVRIAEDGATGGGSCSGVLARGGPGDVPGSGSSAQASAEPTLEPTELPRDFVAVVARRCVLGTVTVPGDGEWQARNDQETTGGLTTLTAALRQPALSDTTGKLVCPLIGMVPIDLTLTDAHGTTIRPAVPHDACGQPLPDVLSMINNLPWRTVAQTRLGRIRSQLEIETGCPSSFKPIDAVAGGAAPGRDQLFNTRPAAMTVCRYRLDATQTVTLDGSPPLAIGVLDTAGELGGARLGALLTAIEAAPAATGVCAAGQSPFALLRSKDGAGPWIAVELTGCHRAADGLGRLRQLDAAAVAPVAA